MIDTKCSHSNHEEGKDCRDRAVACSPTCTCCLDDWAIQYYTQNLLETISRKSGDDIDG